MLKIRWEISVVEPPVHDQTPDDTGITAVPEDIPTALQSVAGVVGVSVTAVTLNAHERVGGIEAVLSPVWPP